MWTATGQAGVINSDEKGSVVSLVGYVYTTVQNGTYTPQLPSPPSPESNTESSICSLVTVLQKIHDLVTINYVFNTPMSNP